MGNPTQDAVWNARDTAPQHPLPSYLHNSIVLWWIFLFFFLLSLLQTSADATNFYAREEWVEHCWENRCKWKSLSLQTFLNLCQHYQDRPLTPTTQAYWHHPPYIFTNDKQWHRSHASLFHPKMAHPSRYPEPHHPQGHIIILEVSSGISAKIHWNALKIWASRLAFSPDQLHISFSCLTLTILSFHFCGHLLLV